MALALTATGTGLAANVSGVASISATAGLKIQFDAGIIQTLGTLAGSSSAALWCIDSDGAGTNPKLELYLLTNASKNIAAILNAPGIGSIQTTYLPASSYPLAGSLVEIYTGWYSGTPEQQLNFYDASGTFIANTTSTNAFGVLSTTGGANGRVSINRGFTGTTRAVTYAGLWVYSARLFGATQNTNGSSSDSGVQAGWVFNDTGNPSTAAASAGGQGLVLTAGQFTWSTSASGWAAVSPTPTTVVVSPSAATISPNGGSQQYTAVVNDQNGNPMAGQTVSWASSQTGVATIGASTGLASAVAAGSTTITATSSSINGTASLIVASGGTTTTVTATVAGSSPAVAGFATVRVSQPTTVTVAPASATITAGGQQQFSATIKDQFGNALNTGFTHAWSVANGALAGVDNTGLVTATTAGTTTVVDTVTSTGNPTVTGSAALTINAASGGGGSGTPNLPSGFTTVFNTGAMLTAPAQTQGGSWSEGNVTFIQLGPTTKNTSGQVASNLIRTPDGSGLRLLYNTDLVGGGAPTRFSVGTINPTGTGWLYIAASVRFSANFSSSSVGYDVKFMEPQTMSEAGRGPGPTEGHIIGQWNVTNLTDYGPVVGTQGPAVGQGVNLLPNLGPAGLLTGGAWHRREILIGPESSPGAGNGTLDEWVDGIHCTHYTNVQWLGAGNVAGWGYLLMDPVFGGTGASPPQNQTIDFDQIFLATK